MQTSFMNYKCNVQRFFNYHVTAIDTFIKRNIYIMHMHGRPQKFFQGGQRRHFALPFSGCERCYANGPLQNALLFLAVA